MSKPLVVISDTSCRILLTKLDALPLLQTIFGRVTVTPTIASEFGQALPDWIDVIPPQDATPPVLLGIRLGQGEISAMALALERETSLVMLDERRGRTVAKRLGLSVLGTLGFLAQAKNAGFIVSVKPYLLKTRQTDFRLTDAIEQQVLQAANEL